MEVSAIRDQSTPSEIQLRAVAVDLEASFLAEMLKFGGAGDARAAYGGGIGESTFSDQLSVEHAKLLAESGGIGLAEHIVKSLLKVSESV